MSSWIRNNETFCVIKEKRFWKVIYLGFSFKIKKKQIFGRLKQFTIHITTERHLIKLKPFVKCDPFEKFSNQFICELCVWNNKTPHESHYIFVENDVHSIQWNTIGSTSMLIVLKTKQKTNLNKKNKKWEKNKTYENDLVTRCAVQIFYCHFHFVLFGIVLWISKHCLFWVFQVFLVWIQRGNIQSRETERFCE